MIDLHGIIVSFLLYVSSLVAMICILWLLILPSKNLTNANVEYKISMIKDDADNGKVVYGDLQTWRFLREKVFEIQGKKCLCCGKSEESMHIDHIKPKSKYPHLEYMIDNLQVLCSECNKIKSYVDETDYRKSDHLISLVREISNNKLLQKKYVHNFELLKVMAEDRFKREIKAS